MEHVDPQEEKKRLDLAKKQAEDRQRQEDHERRIRVLKYSPRKKGIERGQRVDYEHKRNINRRAPSTIKEVEKPQYAQIRKPCVDGKPGPVEHYPIKRIPVTKEITLPPLSSPEIKTPLGWFARLINFIARLIFGKKTDVQEGSGVRKITVETETILEGGEPMIKRTGSKTKTIRIKKHTQKKRYKFQHRDREPVIHYPDSKKFKKKKDVKKDNAQHETRENSQPLSEPT